jgi:hypothetical protein
MLILVAFHLLAVAVLIAVISEHLPRRWYSGFLRGLHASIGITTPNEQQTKTVLIAWIVSTIIIVDVVSLVLAILSRR